jgi:hypothetical protein
MPLLQQRRMQVSWVGNGPVSAVMSESSRDDYLRWWRRIGVWILCCYLVVLVVASVTLGPEDVFGDPSALLSLGLIAFILAAATSPVFAWAFYLASAARQATFEFDRFIRSRFGVGLNANWFWTVVVGVPLVGAAAAWPFGHDFETLSLLAQVNAALLIALTIEGRSALEVVHGLDPAKQLALRFALLSIIGLGTFVVVAGAVVANTKNPPAGADFDWVERLCTGWGLMSCGAALMLLIVSAATYVLNAAANAAGADVAPSARAEERHVDRAQEDS